MTAFADDDFVNYKGKGLPREVFFHKVKGLGWNAEQFKALTDEEVTKVIDGRLKPGDIVPVEKMVTEYQLAGAVAPKTVDINEEVAVPGVFSAGPPLPADEGPIPTAPVQRPVVAGRLDPSQIKRPGTEAIVKKDIHIRAPRSDVSKAMSILEAAFQLAQTDATKGSAKTLINSHGLERAFQTLYPDLAIKVLGRIDTSPDSKRRGGIILDIEDESSDGYIHIITTSGVITIIGHNLAIKE